MLERVSRAIHYLLDRHRGRDIIAVAHGGTIRCALDWRSVSNPRPASPSRPRIAR